MTSEEKARARAVLYRIEVAAAAAREALERDDYEATYECLYRIEGLLAKARARVWGAVLRGRWVI